MKAANRWQRAVALVCVVSFLLTSCTELRNVAVPHGESPPSWTEVKVGDKVVITTKTAKKTFIVTAVEPNALVGKGVRIAYDDMATLDVKYIRKGATTALVITVVAIVVIAVSASEVVHSLGSQIVPD